MSGSDEHLSDLSAPEREQVEQVAEAFEDAWLSGDPPPIDEFLPPDDQTHYLATLVEVVLVDLEFRAKSGERSLVEEYFNRYPQLAEQRSHAANLISREFELARRADPQVQGDEYRRRFPQFAGDLTLPDNAEAYATKRFPIRLNCPHCLEPIAVVDETGSDGVVCPSCQSNFQLDRGRPSTWQTKKLPQLGKFELLQPVGRGSFGAVYRARDVDLDRVVAVKVPRSGAFSTQQDEDRFIREARSVAQLQHPGIVPVFEVGRSELFPYIVTEFVDGITLADYLEVKQLGFKESAQIIADVADALDHAHRQRVVHRDMKPSNIMLERVPILEDSEPPESVKPVVPTQTTFRTRLMDFGLARRDEGEVTVTVEGQPLGTPAYMSPEQARGEGHRVDGRSDVYSLGIILYELITCELPFRGNSRMLLYQVQYDEPIAPRRLNDRIPRDLETACLKAMAKDPRHRYATAGDLAQDLQFYLRGEPIKARPVGRMERAVRWCWRKPLAAALCGTVLLATIAIAAAVYLGLRAQRAEQLADSQQRFAELQEQFDDRLAEPALSSYYIDAMQLLLDEMKALDAPRSAQEKEQFEIQYSDFLERTILRTDASDDEVGQLELVLEAWNQLHPDGGETLVDALRQRRDQVETIFDFVAADDNLEDVIGGMEERSRALIAAGRSERNTLLVTQVSSHGSVQLQATFGDQWQSATAIGLAFGCQEEQSPGYFFLLRSTAATTDADSETDATFSQVRDANGYFQLEIHRGSAGRLKAMQVPSASVETGPLRIFAQRRGRRLQLRINDLPPLKFEEFFLKAGQTRGTFGLVCRPDADLRQLRAERLTPPVNASPLEVGDDLFVAGDFDAALKMYQSQNQQNDPLVREEAQLRQAMCLAELDRQPEAERLLDSLIADGSAQFATLGALHLWLLLLENDDLSRADTVLESLSAQYTFAKLAVHLPNDVRAQVLQAYIETVPFGGYNAVRPAPKRIENLNRALRVLQLLNVHEDALLSTRWWLALSYHHEGNEERALQLIRTILSETDFSDKPRFREEVLEEYVYLLLRTDHPDQALGVVDTHLFDDKGHLRDLHLGLLVERAVVHVALDDVAAAKADMDLLFEQPLDDESRLLSLLRGCLVSGFVHEQIGDSAAAQKMWQRGMEAARNNSHLNVSLYMSLFGSLTNQFTLADTEMTVDMVVAQSNKSPALNYLGNRFVPMETVQAVLKNMWRTTRGRRYAEDMAFFRLPKAESGYVQVLLSSHALWRIAVQGTFELEPPLSDEMDEILWQMTLDLFDQYSNESITETNVVQMALTWKGVTNALGWRGLAGKVSPQCRAPLAYVLGSQCLHDEKLKAARVLLEDALQQAPDGSPLRPLIEARLSELPD